MTKAEKVKQAERQHQRQVAISRLKLVLIVVCLIAIPVTFWWNHREANEVRGRIARVESPCLRYGAHSRQCKRSFEAAVATITHPEACAVERKAGTLRALRELARQLDVNFKEPCRGARLAQERARSDERQASTASSDLETTKPEGGDASDAHTGSSQPGRHEGGASGGGSRKVAPGPGRHKESPENLPPPSSGEAPAAAPAPTAPSSPGASSSSTERATETVVEAAPPAEAPAPVRSATGQLVESVGSTVEGLGETVGGTVEDVESTTCQLAKLLCHE